MSKSTSNREQELQNQILDLVLGLGMMAGTVHRYCKDRSPTMEELEELCNEVVKISQDTMKGFKKNGY